MSELRARLRAAKTTGAPAAVDRARRGLVALAQASDRPVEAIATGEAATQIARIGLEAMKTPPGLACTPGCAFCCILAGDDGGLISEAEARQLHAALAPLAGQPDGRDWTSRACAALDPETRACRAYDARPVLCRAYVSTDAAACEEVAEGKPAAGPGTLGPWHDHLGALGLSRAALKGSRRVATYALARLTAAAVEGADIDTALARARHKPSELDAALKRSRKDSARLT